MYLEIAAGILQRWYVLGNDAKWRFHVWNKLTTLTIGRYFCKDKKELQNLLGTLNFLARHIPNRSEKLEPLHALLRKYVAFHWGEAAQNEAFWYLRKNLSAAPVLAIYDKTKSLV